MLRTSMQGAVKGANEIELTGTFYVFKIDSSLYRYPTQVLDKFLTLRAEGEIDEGLGQRLGKRSGHEDERADERVGTILGGFLGGKNPID